MTDALDTSTAISFTGAPLDLAENRRSDDEVNAFLRASNSRALIMHEGKFLILNNELLWLDPMSLVGNDLYDPGPLFLGLDGEKPVFGFSFAREDQALALADLGSVRGELQGLRDFAMFLPPKDLALCGRAKSLFDWHMSHKFCAMCGKESTPAKAGVTRQCPSCSTEHFPRVNPVVIMLVQDGDRCLMGRGPEWPEGYYSCLAGFVSAGESLEEACTREVFEEVGVKVENIEYQFSQPWPFPSQLMAGLFCTATTTEITLDTNEVVSAKWFDKETVRAVMNGTDQSFFAPPPFTIAHQLLKKWLDQ